MTLFLLSYNKGTASESLRTFDSNSSVLVADFIIPKQKDTAVNDHIGHLDEMVLTNCEKYRHIIEQYDWDVEIALQIAYHESGCRADVVNNNPATKDFSVGIFQINLYGSNAKYRPSEETLKIPEENVAYAYSLWKSSGFQTQWGVCRRSVKCN